MGCEFVEAAGESFELAVGYAVEDSEGGEELDDGWG